MEAKEYRSKDVVWAIFLIFVGTIFLLNTTGVVDWSIWLYIFKFWPVLLVLGGLKLVLGKSMISDIVISILAFLAFAVAGILSYSAATQTRLSFLPDRVSNCIEGTCNVFNNRDGRIVEKKYRVFKDEYVDSVESRYVELNIGGAEFEMSDDSSSSEYFSADASYPISYRDPKLEEKIVQRNRLEVKFDSATPAILPIFYNRGMEYSFVLGRNMLLTDLDITLSAGKGTVVLDDGVYKKIISTIGAGQLTTRLGERSIPSDGLSIDVGAGEMVLELPESVGYTLEYDLGVGNITSNEGEIATFVAGDKTYESENYNSAELKIKITANVGVGSLVINRY